MGGGSRVEARWGLGLAFALGAVLAASCSPDEQRSTTDATSDASTVVEVVDQLSDDEIVVTDTIDPPPATSTSPQTTVQIGAPAGVIVAPQLEIGESDAPPVITGLGAGFVRLQSQDPSTPVAVSSSPDGVHWTPIQSDIGLTYPSQLVANGGSLLAVGSGGDPLVADRMTVWTSADGGAHWTTMPIETRESDSKYVRFDNYVEAVGVTNGLVMLLGRENAQVDWQSFAIDVLGEDHGQMTGMGTTGDGSMRVSFADGVDLIVDPAEVGLDPQNPMPMSVMIWTLVDGVWQGDEQPMGFLEGMNGSRLASGPNGVLAVSRPAMNTAGPPDNDFAALRTFDASTWETAPLPEVLRMEGASPLGGPLGYVVVGREELYHSPDGQTWSEVHRFNDLDAQGTQMAFATAGAAGQAGFAIGISDMGDAGMLFRLLTSTDGMAWNGTSLPKGMEAVVAVSDSAILVQPYVRVASVPQLPPGVDGMREALVSAFAGVVAARSEPLISTDEAQCIADGLIDSVGEERLRAIGFGAYPWTLIGYGLGMPIEGTDAEPMVETFRSCTPRWELLMITSMTEGTQNISESSAECVAEALDDDVAADIFLKELARDDVNGGPNPDMSYLDDAIEAMEACLTPTEMNSIDFN